MSIFSLLIILLKLCCLILRLTQTRSESLEAYCYHFGKVFSERTIFARPLPNNMPEHERGKFLVTMIPFLALSKNVTMKSAILLIQGKKKLLTGNRYTECTVRTKRKCTWLL